MTVINKLILTNYRNIFQAELNFLPTYNCIVGVNGAGKTSVLEALHLLAYGKSFRGVDDKESLIYAGAEEFVVFCELTRGAIEYRLGMQKSKISNTRLRLNGEVCRSIAKFTRFLPLILIEPNSHALLSDGPSQRRHYLDWGLFHVEPNYAPTLEVFGRCLKQRNGALRRGLPRAECQLWDEQLVNLAEKIDAYRREFMVLIAPYFEKMLLLLEFSQKISLRYHPGWDVNYSYSENLRHQIERDLVLGYTGVGPQRADITFTIDERSAADFLSRGQEKLVIAALLFSQAAYYQELSGGPSCFLIDDLPSELDPENRARFFHLISQFPSQYFITAIEERVFSEAKGLYDYKLFHVERGNII